MVCLIFIKKLLYWGEEIIVYNVNSLSAFDLIKGLAAHVSRLIMHGFPAPAVQPQNFPLAAAHHLTDRHARSRRRRPGGYVPRRRPGRPSTSDRRRRGRIDPMGRMWPVGKDHATPRHDRWFDFPPRVAPASLYLPGPTTVLGERFSRRCGYSAASGLMAPGLVPSWLPTRLFLEACCCWGE